MSANHGQTPAAWTGVGLATLGFLVGSVGFLLGPNWTVVIVGGVLVALAVVAAWALSAAGYGERPRTQTRS